MNDAIPLAPLAPREPPNPIYTAANIPNYRILQPQRSRDRKKEATAYTEHYILVRGLQYCRHGMLLYIISIYRRARVSVTQAVGSTRIQMICVLRR
jgi:hypothetical protein